MSTNINIRSQAPEDLTWQNLPPVHQLPPEEETLNLERVTLARKAARHVGPNKRPQLQALENTEPTTPELPPRTPDSSEKTHYHTPSPVETPPDPKQLTHLAQHLSSLDPDLATSLALNWGAVLTLLESAQTDLKGSRLVRSLGQNDQLSAKYSGLKAASDKVRYERRQVLWSCLMTMGSALSVLGSPGIQAFGKIVEKGWDLLDKNISISYLPIGYSYEMGAAMLKEKYFGIQEELHGQATDDKRTNEDIVRANFNAVLKILQDIAERAAQTTNNIVK